MSKTLRITNSTRGSLLAANCETARGFLARGRGLMGRAMLDADGGMLIDPCSSIHTFFMRFPIDVIFIDRANRVVGLYSALPPGRPYAGAWGGRAVIELPTGTIAASATQLGDAIGMVDVAR